MAQRGRPPGHIEKILVDTYVVIPMLRASCHNCGSVYTGCKASIACVGCKTQLTSVATGAAKKVPTGLWSVHKDKQISNSSIMGEVIADGGDAAG